MQSYVLFYSFLLLIPLCISGRGIVCPDPVVDGAFCTFAGAPPIEVILCTSACRTVSRNPSIFTITSGNNWDGRNKCLGSLNFGWENQDASITTLNLGDNCISEVRSESLNTLVNLQHLLLDNNKLQTLPLGLFENNMQLKSLRLQDNSNLTLSKDFVFPTSITTLILPTEIQSPSYRCPVNEYRLTRTAAGATYYTCDPCTMATTKAFSCWSGSHSNIESHHEPRLCRRGYRCNRTTLAEIACPIGTASYEEGVGSEVPCQDCPHGRFSMFTAQLQCLFECPPGKYGTKAGGMSSDACTDCPQGSYCPESGAAAYRLCPAGTFQNLTGTIFVTDCSPCPENTYSITNGAKNNSACKMCPPGKHYHGQGASSESQCVSNDPVECETGQRRAPDGVSCLDCQAGKYAVNLECLDCPVGRYGPRNKSTSCLQCETGKESTKGSIDCNKCVSGKYSLNGVECLACSPGRYQSQEGSSFCEACSIGKFSQSSGSNSNVTCMRCPPGRYQNESGKMFCERCEPQCETTTGSTCIPEIIRKAIEMYEETKRNGRPLVNTSETLRTVDRKSASLFLFAKANQNIFYYTIAFLCVVILLVHRMFPSNFIDYDKFGFSHNIANTNAMRKVKSRLGSALTFCFYFATVMVICNSFLNVSKKVSGGLTRVVKGTLLPTINNSETMTSRIHNQKAFGNVSTTFFFFSPNVDDACSSIVFKSTGFAASSRSLSVTRSNPPCGTLCMSQSTHVVGIEAQGTPTIAMTLPIGFQTIKWEITAESWEYPDDEMHRFVNISGIVASSTKDNYLYGMNEVRFDTILGVVTNWIEGWNSKGILTTWSENRFTEKSPIDTVGLTTGVTDDATLDVVFSFSISPNYVIQDVVPTLDWIGQLSLTFSLMSSVFALLNFSKKRIEMILEWYWKKDKGGIFPPDVQIQHVILTEQHLAKSNQFSNLVELDHSSTSLPRVKSEQLSINNKNTHHQQVEMKTLKKKNLSLKLTDSTALTGSTKDRVLSQNMTSNPMLQKDKAVDVEKKQELPPGWIAHLTDDGKTYYFNELTNQSTWESASFFSSTSSSKKKNNKKGTTAGSAEEPLLQNISETHTISSREFKYKTIPGGASDSSVDNLHQGTYTPINDNGKMYQGTTAQVTGSSSTSSQLLNVVQNMDRPYTEDAIGDETYGKQNQFASQPHVTSGMDSAGYNGGTSDGTEEEPKSGLTRNYSVSVLGGYQIG
eukprot:g3470.t1